MGRVRVKLVSAGIIKPKSIRVDGDSLVVRSVFRTRRIKLGDLRKIQVKRVLSLADEIGVTLRGDRDIFFTDAEPWFLEVVNALDFDARFGQHWYSRAEQGEFLEYQGVFPDGIEV
jgi:hypothetical protein